MHEHVHVVAKQCRSDKCVREGRVRKEASILSSLQRQYGTRDTIGFLGACHAPYEYGNDNENGSTTATTITRRQIENQATNFSVGDTLLMEMGTPLVAGWGILQTPAQRECFAKHFTEADLHGLRTIARQYANSTRCITKMEGVGRDNVYAEQYIITKVGLRHGDFDNAQCCHDSDAGGDGGDGGNINCTYSDVLEFNCNIVSQVAHKPLVCHEEGSVPFPHDHINTTEAIMKCVD